MSGLGERFLFAGAVLPVLLVAFSGCNGTTGRTYIRESDGRIGPVIANVAVAFIKEDASSVRRAASDANGQYSTSLDAGRYYTIASHPDFEDYTSAPGFLVARSNTRGTANFFLRAPQVTTVLIVRHAEKLDPNSNDPTVPLSPDGNTRAEELRDTLLRAGISAVYSTAMVRTRSTGAPLANMFDLTSQDYTSPAGLAATVLAQHRGDVVLVAAHSDSVAAVANAFGAQVDPAVIADFDNLYVVSVSGTETNAVNLQYAADSPQDLEKNDRRAMTLLLVGTGTGGDPQLPARLLHAVRKASLAALYTSGAGNPLLSPLGTALGLTPASYNAADMPAFVTRLIAGHARETVVVAGTKEELQQLIRQIGGSPFPVIYDTDFDQLIVVTRFASGAIRVVPVRF